MKYTILSIVHCSAAVTPLLHTVLLLLLLFLLLFLHAFPALEG